MVPDTNQTPREDVAELCARRDDEWIPVEVERDRAALLESAHKLELAWPGRYEIRITPDGEEFGLSVRHRS